ncbi:hypothetical protein JHK85_024653 [Glycine max]|uniref:Uncharacterized protein n=2 Tax=Glycine subgen. Soja TaxID=1462606 RepID=K7LBW8_SOYBN|nr:hypothetical protein JHK85_024653 [Glycine max]KAG5011907.1 hypothetical protein JHK86_024168 [Glycine max]KAH1041601.1 hypothetical protein GYH30_024114 [Glycine max]RZB90711.1 hypothetical protein D0Y65_023256 [Glycine soja]
MVSLIYLRNVQNMGWLICQPTSEIVLLVQVYLYFFSPLLFFLSPLRPTLNFWQIIVRQISSFLNCD